MRGAYRVRRWLSRLSVGVGMGFVVLIAWLWFSLLSPWGYVPPPGLPPIEPGTMHRVFAYGTLRKPIVRWLVIGRSTPAQPATLPDFRKQGLNLVPQAGAHTPGEVFMVDADELRRLDRYERLGIRYQRSMLTLEAGKTAWVYCRLDNNET